jgi:hypothetical protein
MATAAAQPTLRPFLNGLRSPVVSPVTRFAIGVPLVLLTTQTARYFAWTIDPPMTAGFLGARMRRKVKSKRSGRSIGV